MRQLQYCDVSDGSGNSFPGGEGGADLIFGIIFAGNCMQMEKKIRLSGGNVTRTSALRVVNTNAVT